MDLEDKGKITKNLRFIKENMSESSLLKCVDCLIEKCIFSMEQGQTIRMKTTLEEKCQFFINDLLKSPPSAYGVFLNALKESGNGHIIDVLEGNVAGNIHFS